MNRPVQIKAIPQDPTDPLLGNIRQLDPNAPIQSFGRIADRLGEIFRFQMVRDSMIFVNSHRLIQEICDEERFEKAVTGSLSDLRALGGDGLFTARNTESNWSKASRILTPSFSPAGIQKSFEQMYDIAEQLVLKWERQGPDAQIDVCDDMTRLTLDTIALCSFDYRFNSFYRDDMHPYVTAMVDSLDEALKKRQRLGLMNKLKFLTRRNYEANIAYMHRVADELIAARKRDPHRREKQDLLNRMLEARDPVSGEGLSDENIRYQMATFLIAGHETTSGMLSFALYHLVKHPEILERARRQVVDVIGRDGRPRVEQMGRLTYIDQILKETLRLTPSVGAILLRARENTLLGGEYRVPEGATVVMNIQALHKDRAVWGEDVDEFRPERFTPEAEASRPEHSWKPFGNGKRACIGRPFAMQEATLALAMILQRFDLNLEDPAYTLRIKESLTMKPDGFYLRVRRRRDFAGASVVTGAVDRDAGEAPQFASPAPSSESAIAAHTQLPVLFGSNSGSSEDFARRIVADLRPVGFVTELFTLDEYLREVLQSQGPGSATAASLAKGPLVIVTASYEGRPCENARQFLTWLEALQPESAPLAGLSYSVFGCGNRDWARTYQAVPRKIDALLAAAGARRIYERGEADARGDFFGAFENWYAGLRQRLFAEYSPADSNGLASGAATGIGLREDSGMHLRVERLEREEGAAELLRQPDLVQGRVLENRELANPAGPGFRSKRHLEIALPAAMSYRAGDYLAVLPENSGDLVDRALRRFDFHPEDTVRLHAARSGAAGLPTKAPVRVRELLERYVELAQPATRRQVERLAELYAGRVQAVPTALAELREFADDARYPELVLEPRLSVLDLLERFPECPLDFAEFLSMAPRMKPRQYSISSSPLVEADRCSLTIAVVDAPAWGDSTRRFRGAASGFLADASADRLISVAVRKSPEIFHLPEDPETPLILIGAGSGIAPLRGFLQERAYLHARGVVVGQAALFFGCDHPETDYIYQAELEAWRATGFVELFPTFMNQPALIAETNAGDASEPRDFEVRFVQHRLWLERERVMDLVLEAGAYVFVCGDGRHMAPAVRDAFVRMHQTRTGLAPRDSEAWLEELERVHGRYAADVFA